MPNLNHKSGSKLTAWLDKIQQDSWQLELVISGFVIFLLLGAWKPIMDLEYEIWLLIDINKGFLLTNIFYFTVRTGYQALLLCLIIHLILRGLWIAVIGLRSVSGDIEYDELHYQPKFTNWLKKKIGTFDDYIERLERYCSVIFSLAFLILFCFIGIAIYFIVAALLQFILFYLNSQGEPFRGFDLLGNLPGAILLLMGFLYLVDFVTLGFFKRNRFTAKPYFYIYRVMGWLTLARFYRPLYYNLIDHRFGRRLARLLPLFILGMLIVVSIQFIRYTYFPYFTQYGKEIINTFSYDDLREETLGHQIWIVSLNSKYVNNNYIEVFVPYRPSKDNRVLESIYPDITPAQYVGLKLWGAFSIGQRYNPDVPKDELLQAMGSIHKLYIDDSLRVDVPPRFFYHNERKQAGLLYMVPTHQLNNGEHQVIVETQRIRSDSLYWYRNSNIYFYK